MMVPAVILAGAALGAGVIIVEKKRKAGTLTYPLWKGNPWVLWAWLVVMFASIMLMGDLPRVAGLVRHGMEVEATIVKQGAYCQATYSYKVGDREYTGTDSECGLMPGSKHIAYYDASDAESSTLHSPSVTLKSTLLAMLAVSFLFPTVIVLWLRATWIIGRAEKS